MCAPRRGRPRPRPRTRRELERLVERSAEGGLPRRSKKPPPQVAADRTDDLARALRLRVGERAVSVEDALGLVLVESLAAATGGTA
jgi:uncharacterized protein YgbK (DUF1537 family)